MTRLRDACDWKRRLCGNKLGDGLRKSASFDPMRATLPPLTLQNCNADTPQLCRRSHKSSHGRRQPTTIPK
jgi:hypothetical protein